MLFSLLKQNRLAFTKENSSVLERIKGNAVVNF